MLTSKEVYSHIFPSCDTSISPNDKIDIYDHIFCITCFQGLILWDPETMLQPHLTTQHQGVGTFFHLLGLCALTEAHFQCPMLIFFAVVIHPHLSSPQLFRLRLACNFHLSVSMSPETRILSSGPKTPNPQRAVPQMPLRAKLAGIPQALKSPADRPSCYLWFLSSCFSERDQGPVRATHPSPLTNLGPFSISREGLSPFGMPTSVKTAWLQKSTRVLMFSQKQACFTSSSSRSRPWAKFPCQWCVKEVDSGETGRGIRKTRGEEARQERDFRWSASLSLLLQGALEHKLYSRVGLMSSQGLLGLQDQSVFVMDSTAET